MTVIINKKDVLKVVIFTEYRSPQFYGLETHTRLEHTGPQEHVNSGSRGSVEEYKSDENTG